MIEKVVFKISKRKIVNFVKIYLPHYPATRTRWFCGRLKYFAVFFIITYVELSLFITESFQMDNYIVPVK